MTRSQSHNTSSFVRSQTSLHVQGARQRAISLWRELSQQRKTPTSMISNGDTTWENASHQLTIWLAASGLLASVMMWALWAMD